MAFHGRFVPVQARPIDVRCGVRAARALAALLVLALSPALGGCEQVDVVAVAVTPPDASDEPVPDAAQDGATEMDAAPGSDAEVDAAVDAASDSGPPDTSCPYRRATAEGSDLRVDEVVARGLAHAICTCTGWSGGGELIVDAAPGSGAAADVGIDESFDQQLSATIDGALSVAGVDGIGMGPDTTLRVGAALASFGPLEGATATVEVAADAAVNGRIDLGGLQVAGTLTQAPGESFQVATAPSVGELRSAAVTVAPPCACDPSALLDVGAHVRAAAQRVMPLAEGENPAGRCAEFWFDGGTVDTLALQIAEPTALYVGADLQVDALTIETAPGAELDLFLEGNLRVTGSFVLGSPDGGVVRLHVGGTGTIDLAGGGELHGALYAPNAELVLSAPLTVTGALFTRRVAAAAAVTVHADPRVLAAP